MIDLVILIEEPSVEEMLKEILPRINHEIKFRFMPFQGKQDLDKRIELRLRYWNQPNSSFLIIRDQDSGDCLKIKSELMKKVESSGKGAVSLIRIACHELENFYLGDLEAVEKGLKIKGLSKMQMKSKYRNPDSLNNASDELIRLTDKKYQKVIGSREIAPHMRLDGNNKSHSFNTLISGIEKLLSIKQ